METSPPFQGGVASGLPDDGVVQNLTIKQTHDHHRSKRNSNRKTIWPIN